MKKQLFIFSLLSLAVALTDLQAARPSKESMGPKTMEESAQEWMQKHATHEQKKLIFNLRYYKLGRFGMILEKGSTAYKIFMSLPDYVQQYYKDIFGNFLCVGDECKTFLAECTKRSKSKKGIFVGYICPKREDFNLKRAEVLQGESWIRFDKQDMKNFDNDEYIMDKYIIKKRKAWIDEKYGK